MTSSTHPRNSILLFHSSNKPPTNQPTIHPSFHPNLPSTKPLIMSDPITHGNKGYKDSRSPSPEFQGQCGGDQPDTANEERKKVQSLETRRPQRGCLQAQGQHVPSAHASHKLLKISSVSNADTVPLAGRPALQTYARLFVPFIQLTHLFFLFRTAAEDNGFIKNPASIPELIYRLVRPGLLLWRCLPISYSNSTKADNGDIIDGTIKEDIM